MTELSKEMKIVMIINIIAGLLFAFIYIIIPDILSKSINQVAYDPHTTQVVGGSILVLTIGGIIAFKRNEWEGLKLLWEVIILWDIITLILNFVALVAFPMSSLEIANMWFNIILLIVLTILNVYIYMREEK